MTNELLGTDVRQAIFTSSYAAGVPVQLYFKQDGSLNALNGVVDGSSVPQHWGVVLTATNTGVAGPVVIKGKVVTASAPTTSDQAATAIAIDGTVTQGAFASTNADLCLGVTWASGIIIY